MEDQIRQASEQSPVTVERVTEPKPLAKPSKEKDPKKVTAGRAGAAACKVRQDKLLEEFRVAKETLCCSNSCSTDTANVATANTVPAPQIAHCQTRGERQHKHY